MQDSQISFLSYNLRRYNSPFCCNWFFTCRITCSCDLYAQYFNCNCTLPYMQVYVYVFWICNGLFWKQLCQGFYAQWKSGIPVRGDDYVHNDSVTVINEPFCVDKYIFKKERHRSPWHCLCVYNLPARVISEQRPLWIEYVQQYTHHNVIVLKQNHRLDTATFENAYPQKMFRVVTWKRPTSEVMCSVVT